MPQWSDGKNCEPLTFSMPMSPKCSGLERSGSESRR
jgi:hypothetical protein